LKNPFSKGNITHWPKEVVIYTDGASRGNPGKASTGIVVYDKDGNCLYEEASFIGIKTNNFAEYSAVLRALELSTQNKVQSLVLKSDSELLIKQLTGFYKVRSNNIKNLYQQCKKWEVKMEQVTFQHIRREYNKKADALANFVLDHE